MKFTVTVLILFLCIFYLPTVIKASVSRSPPHPSRKPGGCYKDSTGHLTAGQKITISGKCKSAKCASSGIIIYHSCGFIDTTTPGCRPSPPDFTKPYPDCCPRIIC